MHKIKTNDNASLHFSAAETGDTKFSPRLSNSTNLRTNTNPFIHPPVKTIPELASECDARFGGAGGVTSITVAGLLARFEAVSENGFARSILTTQIS